MFDSQIIQLKKSYSKNIVEVRALINRLYPDFIFKSHLHTLKGEIPVFTFHSVKANKFEDQLKFLVKNDYKTLDANDFYKYISRDLPPPDRSIMLSFDDGLGNLWSIAYPLLKKYGLKAVAFIVPSYITEEAKYFPNLEDFWNGKASLQEVENRELNSVFCSWQEIRVMHESGIIDFQSHTMHHGLIFNSPKIVDFIHTGFDLNYGNFNVPIFNSGGVDNLERTAEMGMPIYCFNSRMSEKKRYYDDEKLREKCIDYVREEGSESFFKKRNWRKVLKEVVSEYRRKYGLGGYYESDMQQKENIFNELWESRCLIEERLRGKKVEHFAYPWWEESALSVEMSKRAGFLSNFCGILKGKRTNKTGDDLYQCVRLRYDDYIYRLPGVGRRSLRNTLGSIFLKSYSSFSRKFLTDNIKS